MKNCIRLALLLLVSIASAYGQEKIDSAIVRLNDYPLLFPREKVYVMTDKPYYISGEDIFFRSFLINSYTNRQDCMSRYTYVELINPMDSVIERLQVRAIDSAFYGTIQLPEDLEQGTYRLRAYTHFMRNFGEEDFFQKEIEIKDPLFSILKTEIRFESNEKNEQTARLIFYNKQDSILFRPKVIVIKEGDKISKYKPDDNGIFHINLKPGKTADRRMLCLEVECNNRMYKQFIQIPSAENEFHVSFLPEGGHLVAGDFCVVAFKALQSDGLSIEVAGEIRSDLDSLACTFQSSHRGMGKFSFIPEPGRKYRAVCRSEGFADRQFDLPEVLPNSISLKVNPMKDNLVISALHTPEFTLPPLFLVVMAKGIIYHLDAWDSEKKYILLDRNQFPSGIIQLLLFNAEGEAITERLFFNENPGDTYQVNWKTNKNSYAKRELVRNTISLQCPDSMKRTGSFALSVTDKQTVVPDSCNTIVSELLLSSELRGHIEDPYSYFMDNDPKTRQYNLDLIMLTHGWRKYNVKEIAAGNYPDLSFPLEMRQSISGNITGGLLLNRKVNEALITLLTIPKGPLLQTTSQADGTFLFEGFELSDSTQIIANAFTKTGGQRIGLNIAPLVFPEVSPSAFALSSLNEDSERMDQYVGLAEQKYTTENGARMILLDEVVITARKRNKYDKLSIVKSDFSIDLLDNKSNLKQISKLITTIPFVSREGSDETGNPIFTYKGKAIKGFMLNNFRTSGAVINSLSVEEIASINFIDERNGPFIMGDEGTNGIIQVMLRRGEDLPPAEKRSNHGIVDFLGYHTPKEFYSPAYDYAEAKESPVPDLRTTLFWKPDLKTNEQGEIVFEFYTADKKPDYTLTMEGITDDGQIIFYRTEMTN